MTRRVGVNENKFVMGAVFDERKIPIVWEKESKSETIQTIILLPMSCGKGACVDFRKSKFPGHLRH